MAGPQNWQSQYPQEFVDYINNQLQNSPDGLIDDGSGQRTPFDPENLSMMLSNWQQPNVNGQRYFASLDQTTDPSNPFGGMIGNSQITLPDGRTAIPGDIADAIGKQTNASSGVHGFLDGPGPVMALGSLVGAAGLMGAGAGGAAAGTDFTGATFGNAASNAAGPIGGSIMNVGANTAGGTIFDALGAEGALNGYTGSMIGGSAAGADPFFVGGPSFGAGGAAAAGGGAGGVGALAGAGVAGALGGGTPGPVFDQGLNPPGGTPANGSYSTGSGPTTPQNYTPQQTTTQLPMGNSGTGLGSGIDLLQNVLSNPLSKALANFFVQKGLAKDLNEAAQMAAQMSNPLSQPQRQPYQQQLFDVMVNGNYQGTPFYQGQKNMLDQDLQAKLAKYGVGGTPFLNYADQNQNLMSRDYFNLTGQLGQLGGFTMPGNASAYSGLAQAGANANATGLAGFGSVMAPGAASGSGGSSSGGGGKDPVSAFVDALNGVKTLFS